jgi:ATP-dependent Clp protease adaptor protein ClpS
MHQHSNTLPSVKNKSRVNTKNSLPLHLIVWNDEVNTFEWVIDTLIDVCKHTAEQAEQCAFLIHFKGKYTVKEGSYDQLKPMCNAITERGINATVESLVS